MPSSEKNSHSGESFKPFPAEFDGRADQRDYRFKQLKRVDGLVLLEKRLKTGGDWVGYEVVKVQYSPAGKRIIKGVEVIYEAKEIMPSPERWGDSGFSFLTLEDANRKFFAIQP